MTANLQRPGQIGLNEKWNWVVEGIELKMGRTLEIRIGGHWILGVVIETKDRQLFWSSWLDSVSIPVTCFIHARWPKEA